MSNDGTLLVVAGVAVLGYVVYREVVSPLQSAVTTVTTDPFSPGGVVGPITPPPPKPGGAAPHNPYGTETYKGHKWHSVDKGGKWVWAAGPAPTHHKGLKPPRKVHKTPPKVQNLPANPKHRPKVKKLPAPVRAKNPHHLVAI